MKRFISGFVTASLLFGITALAASPQAANIFYNNIKIKVYGQEVDTEGNEPFILNDRTYVPARYVAEAMGGEVLWDGETNTVEIISASQAVVPNKLTSDGLEAKYSYSDEEYCVPFLSVLKKYDFPYVVSDDWKTITLYNADKSKSTSFSPQNIGETAIPYDEYENVILPFILSE